MKPPGWSLEPGAALPLSVLHGGTWFAMLAHGNHWTGGWRNAVDTLAGTVVITGPLLAALVAHAYARRTETSLPVLTVTAVHPARAWYRPFLGLTALAVVNLGAVLLEVAFLVAAAGTPLLAEPLVVLPVCALVLSAHALAGMVVGLRVRPQLAGALAGAASFGLFLLAVAHLAPAAFVLGGASGDLVGTAYRPEVVVALGATAVASAAALATGTAWRYRRPGAWVAVAVGATALAMVLGSGGVVDLDRRFEPVDVALRCRGDAPQVCLPAEAPRALPAVSRRMRQLADPLRSAGAELPRRWVYSWGQRPEPGDGVLTLWSGDVLGRRPAGDALVHSLATPAACPAFSADMVDERALAVRSLLESWLRVRNGLRSGGTRTPHTWFAGPRSEAWVRTTYAQLRRCDLASLRYPHR